MKVNRVKKLFNYADGRGIIRVSFNADKTDEPAEILICEEIGSDPWSGQGFTVKDLRSALDSITPRTRDLNILMNSPGGSVSEGCAIRNLLEQWQGNITNTIIGVAASTASWCIPANVTRAYKNSQVFLHRCMAFTMGNADDLRRTIDFLETTDGQIAQMYADQAGGEPDEYLDLMKDETLLTGQQAKDLGLVDEIVDGEAQNNFSDQWLNAAKQKLAALNSLRSSQQGASTDNHQPKDTSVNLQQKLALLNKRGITPPANCTESQADELITKSNIGRTMNISILTDWKVQFDAENATDEQLTKLVKDGKPVAANNAPAPIVLDQVTKDRLERLEQREKAQRREIIQNKLTKFAEEGRITVNQIEEYTNLAAEAQDDPVKGNPIINLVSKNDPKAPGIPALPENLNKLEVVSAAIQDLARGFEAHDEASKAWQRGNNNVSMETIRNNAVAKANFFKKFRNRFLEVMNTNTIATELKRQVILQDVVIRDFVRRVLSLNMFSTVFQNVPLQGLNTVEVPYYDLDSSASTSFVSGTGYTTIGNTTTDKREITIGEGAANGDRLYQALQFSSQEIARQPYLKIAELAGLKAEKLAFDIWQDILSIITAANYGAAAITKVSALFSSDDLADLKLACKAWPEMGRGLILDSAYDANLLKDPSFKHALNAASDSAIKEGRLYPRVMGFDYTENPNIPANGENLVGFAVFKYAILVAFAPVPPVEEVRNAGTVWELITDPATGISLEYRRFGDNVKDLATNVIESSYGFAKGLGTGLKRITSA